VPVSNDDLQVNPLVTELLKKFEELRTSVQDKAKQEGREEDLLDPPELVVLRGFLGQSDEDGSIRLYHDPSLSVWSDIPTEYIAHVEHLEKSESRPWGEDVVWMVRGSLEHVQLPGDAGRVRAAVYRPARVRGRR